MIAPARAGRPVDTGPREDVWATPDDAPANDADPECPFCPGNEHELPAILTELRHPSGQGWSFRAVPNRFAALPGAQEVLIESPAHLDELSTMDQAGLERALEGYHARYAAMADRNGIGRVILFRNRGRNAGNSLRHPHAQLVGLEADPPQVRSREATFREFVARSGGVCPLCAPGTFEPDFEARLLRRTRHHTCWVPWAAEAPFEVWIAPVRHVADFRESSGAEERQDLAGILGWVTRRYRDVAGDPAFNLLLHAAGTRDPGAADLHWWIRLLPRIGRMAGLELLTGVRVNSSSPERDAERLARHPDGAGA